MRIVIDMQGAQTKNRHRGIGRYTMLLAQAIVRNRGKNEVFLALNGLFPETIEEIRAAFDGLMPQDHIRVWQAPGPVCDNVPSNAARREVAEIIREGFLASLKPDVIHISSLFEGHIDNAVTSIGRFDKRTPVSVSLYELIPLLNPEQYLEPNPIYAEHYHRKIENLKRAAICLAISDSAVQDGVREMGSAIQRIVNVASPLYLMRSDVMAPSVLDEKLIEEVSRRDDAFWDQCAENAITEFVSLLSHQKQSNSFSAKSKRPRLAFVSPLPPERTGIADYSAELLPALAEYYEIDVVVAQDRVDDQWVSSHLEVRDVEWLRANAHRIDRVLYHFGNSPFHQHMFSLLKEIPGAVVLHDFFLGDLLAWIEYSGSSDFWKNALYLSHGYKALCEAQRHPGSARSEYPANLEILQSALGLVFHSQYARHLAKKWYGETFATAWDVVPLLRSPAVVSDRTEARKKLGVKDDDFLICSFGFLGAGKLNHRLIECWFESALSKNRSCQVVFVGENDGGDYGLSLLQYIRSRGLDDRVSITGFATPELYRNYLISADLAVQLRANSRGETSAAVLDCLNYGLPLIVNANGSMAELDAEAVWMLSDEFENSDLSEALDVLWRDPIRRQLLGARAKEVILDCHAPDKCALRYFKAIEGFYKKSETATARLIEAVADVDQLSQSDDSALRSLAADIAANFPLFNFGKRLFLDVTVTCQDDFKTGIQRVVRAISIALLEGASSDCRIEPVYLSDRGGEWHYRHAQRYTLELLGCSLSAADDSRVEPKCGDVLLVLDLTGGYLLAADASGLYKKYRNLGVGVYSVVYDLLPVRMPEVFPPDADFHHGKWLEAISRFDGALCISKAVADDLIAWQAEVGIETRHCRPFRIGWFHLGADVGSSSPSQGLPDNAEWTLRQLRARPSFLMVGTIEPRKGYLQAIDAFSQLWSEGAEINLVIVGKEGWKGLPEMARRDIPRTIECLRSHSELNRHLFFLESISDEYLEKVYGASACLIAASFGEGFGLPLIEAAQYKLPIIARDIPVFREVAGENAYFFEAEHGSSGLVAATRTWLQLYENRAHPKSDGMLWLTWKKSAEQLLNGIFFEGA